MFKVQVVEKWRLLNWEFPPGQFPGIPQVPEGAEGDKGTLCHSGVAQGQPQGAEIIPCE